MSTVVLVIVGVVLSAFSACIGIFANFDFIVSILVR